MHIIDVLISGDSDVKEILEQAKEAWEEGELSKDELLELLAELREE